jgi:predicted O-linked N-acetylglucosamine transferase (SPINDLY family)
LSTRESFDTAFQLFQAGQTGDAERLLDRILRAEPRHFAATLLLGICHHEGGRRASGMRMLDAAVALRPDVATAHFNRGLAQQRDLRFDDALASYERAAALDPGFAEAHFRRGGLLYDAGRHADALRSLEQATAAEPGMAEAHDAAGVAMQKLGRVVEALARHERAIALNPRLARAHSNRGMALQSLGRVEEALDSYRRATGIDAGYAEAWYNTGLALCELKRNFEALACYERAIALRPDFASAHNNRGLVLHEVGRYEEALASYRRAIDIDPGYAGAHANAAEVFLQWNDYAQAASLLDRALALDAGLPYARGQRLHARMQLCDWRDYGDDVAAVLAAIDAGAKASYPFAALAIPSSPAQQLAAARIFVADRFPAAAEPLWRGEAYGHERIRIGYFSTDFRNHPVAHLTAQVFELHDRSKFEIFGFSLGPDADDPMRQRLRRAFDRFFDLRARSDFEIASLARQLEVDIAVDLNGFTGNARPGIFALRPAPVQANYLGYQGSTGAGYIDYLIADAVVIPPGQREHYSEKIVHLPHCFQANDSTKAIADRPLQRADFGLPEQGLVFCCFNNAYKITPDLFGIWMGLLRELPGSVLWLAESNPAATDNLRREAAARGVAPARLVFAARVELADYLAQYRLADLFLDSFHYNAGTTASDALWAGLPVLTCAGDSFARRMAASLLTAVGLPKLITHSPEAYAALALELARNPARLAGLRDALARKRNDCPLFYTPRFSRDLEAAYRQMWQLAEAGLPPADLTPATDSALQS